MSQCYYYHEDNLDEDEGAVEHRRIIKRKLDQQLESRWLKAALEDDFDEDAFDWDNILLK